MEVRARGLTGRPDASELRAARHLLPHSNRERGQVRVHRDDAAAVGDLHQVPVAARVEGGEDHTTGPGGSYRRAGRGRQVEPRMEARASGTEGTADQRAQRPGERDRAARQRRPQRPEGRRPGDAVDR